MKEKKIIAIVVTYNRKKLLKECINALINQKYNNLDILIIDNASTDGTYDYIKELLSENVIYKNTGNNLGGAGGFNYGMKVAYNLGCDYMWIMDDDCIVQKNSLIEMVKADKTLNGRYGFLSSVVLFKNNEQCLMNKQKICSDWYRDSYFLGDGLIPTYYSTFVSFFIKTSVVEEMGLPIKEFFIWGDDVEYSNRISKKYRSYIVGKSKVIHKVKENIGSNIVIDNSERIARYKYAYRNECVVARENGIIGRIRQFLKVNYHIIKIIFSKSKYKVKKIFIIINSSIKGIFFRPSIEYLKGEQNNEK